MCFYRNIDFRGIFGHFISFRGYFDYSLGLGGILVMFKFQGYFGQFLGFGGILVIFLGFRGISVKF